MKLNNETLLSFADGFLGYGNPSATHWFVGMEEGGGNSVDEIAARLVAWERRGKRDFDDVKAFCCDTGHAALIPWGSDTAPRQKTWVGLIKTLGITADPLTYQRTEWLTETGETCLVNLLPLPSPGTDTWNYAAWSDLPELQTRKGYTAAFVGKRIERIRTAIQTHRPERVTFVGFSNAGYWAQISEGITGVAFDTIMHPAARGNHSAVRRLAISSPADCTVAVAPAKINTEESKTMMTQEQMRPFLERLFQALMEKYPAQVKVYAVKNDHWRQINLHNSNAVLISFQLNPRGNLRFEWTIEKNIEPEIQRLEGRLQKIQSLLGHGNGQNVSCERRTEKRALFTAEYTGDDSSEDALIRWAVPLYHLFLQAIGNEPLV